MLAVKLFKGTALRKIKEATTEMTMGVLNHKGLVGAFASTTADPP